MYTTVKEGRSQRGEGGQAKRTSLGEVGESMSGMVNPKALQENLESLGFITSLAKTEMGKEIERRRAAHNMTGLNESE